MAIRFRDLRADEIEVRVAQAKQNGVALLLYKDARVDMRILDETVGQENWQKEFYEHKGTLFCRVGIRAFADVQNGADMDSWVWKSDAGEPSNTSAQKGEASDAFKRACFNWGLGRELYTAPFIWVKPERANIRQNGQKYQCFDRFSVAKIEVKDGTITGIRIVNDSKGGEVAFSWRRTG